MINRIRLIKSWKMSERRTYAIGTILQVDNELRDKLLKLKKGELYEGEYPPRDKQKIELKQLN